MKRLESQRNRGITLVELLLAVGLSTVVMLGMMQLIGGVGDLIHRFRLRWAMQRIGARIEVALADPQNIGFSAALLPAVNVTLRSCVLNDVDLVCGGAAIDPYIQSSFALLRATRDVARVVAALGPVESDTPETPKTERREGSGSSRWRQFILTGTADNPALYDKDGGVCGWLDTLTAEQQQDCPFEVVSHFWASCYVDKAALMNRGADTSGEVSPLPAAVPALGCPRAETVHVRYQVRHRSGPAVRGSVAEHRRPMAALPSVPRDQIYWRNGKVGSHHERTAIDVAVAQITTANLDLPSCFDPGSDERYVGAYTLTRIYRNEAGRQVAECHCQPPLKETRDGVSRICRYPESTCGPGERYVGVSAAGQPVCRAVHCSWRKKFGQPFDFSCAQEQGGARHSWLSGFKDFSCSCPPAPGNGPIPKDYKWRMSCDMRCEYEILCCEEDGQNP